MRFASSKHQNSVENSERTDVQKATEYWSILVVDDDQAVHDVTRLILRDMKIADRTIKLTQAYSAQEATKLLEQENDYCVILLDVVMENDHAGLDLVNYIRKVLNNQMVRIVLRTGQPGQAPELSVISDYDINDYKEKSELTSQKLKACITAAIRSYRDLQTIHDLADQRAILEQKTLLQNVELQTINQQLKSEIMERTLAEEELDLTNKKLSSIINNSSAIISLKDIDGHYDLVNDAFIENLKLNTNFSPGKSDSDLFNLETAEMIRYNDKLVMQDREAIQCEEILPTKKGEHFYLCVKFPLYDKNGDLYRICTISTDITDRLEAQNQILHYSQYDSLTYLNQLNFV